MKRMHGFFTTVIPCAIFLLFMANAGFSAPAIEYVNIVDVTPSGFSVIWQTTAPATPEISVYSDAAGTMEITGNLETVAFPLHSGDPAIAGEYQSGLSKDSIRDQAISLGMVKMSVYGCAPDTAYYVKVRAGSGSGMTTWPESNPVKVVTAAENAFILDGKQLLVSLSNDARNLEAGGWIISAGPPGMLSQVSGIVGDGAGKNQACLNLNNFFDMDGNNRLLSGPEVIDLTLRIPGVAPVQQSLSIPFSGDFNVSDLVTHDINIDDLLDTNTPPFEPSVPDPGMDAANISVQTALAWQGGDPDDGDTVTYDVYYRTDKMTEFIPACEGIAATVCHPDMLEFGTTYFWQVTARDSEGRETPGPQWRFTTFASDGDEDNDQLSNENEISLGADPFDCDSDRDGYRDGEEFHAGADPMDRMSRPSHLPGYGDINGDQTIDGQDLALLVSSLGTSAGNPAYKDSADFNGDGVIDQADLELFSRVFGYGSGQDIMPPVVEASP